MIVHDTPTTLKEQVKKYIIEMIKSGKLKEDERLESEISLAGRFSVSRVTVRHAILELANEGSLYRIQGKGTYISNPFSENIQDKPGSSNIIVIGPLLKDMFILNILDGIQEVCRKKGFNMIFASSKEDLHEEAKLIIEYRRQKVDGFIIFPVISNYYNDEIIRLYCDKIPFVLIDHYYRRLKTDCVVSDNVHGAYDAVSYLLRLGHKRVAFVSEDMNFATSVQDRFTGYCNALKDYQLSIDNELILGNIRVNIDFHFGPDTPYTEEERVNWNEILYGKQMPSAFFCTNDLLAADLMRYLKREGYQIPLDISIIGFDNTSWIEHLSPPLDSVSQDKRGMGEKAALILIDKINHPSNEVKIEKIPTQLITRSSSSTTKKA